VNETVSYSMISWVRWNVCPHVRGVL
jgi:hypothetical protein